MESGSSGNMEDSSATSQAPPIPCPPPEPWEYDPCPMTENNDPFDQQNQSTQPSEPADAASPLSETSKKSRKRRSPHWEHFIKKDGENKAECIYCHTFIGCASLQGTSGMKNHIKRCKEYPPNIDQNQQLLSLSQQTLDGNLVDQKKGRLELWKFNQEDSRRALAKMVIMDEMSFRTVEHEGFRNFMKEVEDMDSDVDVAELEFERQVGSCVGVQGKNELAKYLEDDREVNPAGKSFDCLGWWKKYGERYPTIALMARDVLAIPVSTVASESAFSTGGRVLDSFRSSLSTKMVEALICAQDWLRTSQGPLILEERLEDMEKIESEMLPLGEEHSLFVDDD
ncbi:zinc finger BED domain-containing protein RICESLEEPER 3-like [Chenopodium quinoa]|uniref:zinc finger BED domain-containing protein RICESLEEPER 3-like n=1 Tax=Chenopodium quinoa TaxID=63459 RepID=UPI000B7977A1|nr:zinc finger BED domain-containing protein RICESLEEPER 3-like [Chenopodium quinoa]XP_021749799.1 zinc finger BED domain-containing protein RICESLEEPER 3-like [Chenopodium quinoa]